MKTSDRIVEHIERLEDQLQAMKWVVTRPRLRLHEGRTLPLGIVAQTAGLLRGRLPRGVVYQRRLRREWDTRRLPKAR